MRPYYVAVILGYSIAIAAAIGLICFKKIRPAYQPFIFLICLSLFNHTLSFFMVEYVGSNTINANIYVLFDSLLYLWLFKNWGVFRRRVYLFNGFMIFLVAVWVIDNLFWHTLSITNSFFRIIYSFILIFLSIEQLNILISSAKKNLLINTCFLVCCGIIIYYPYKATIEVFFLIRLKASSHFYASIFSILVYVNLFVNLIFAWATLWIPKKLKFTLLP